MKRSLCALALCSVLSWSACGEDEPTSVAGSTSDDGPDQQAGADATAPDPYRETPEKEPVPPGQLPDDERVYEKHSELTADDAIATIEHYFYGPYDLETCELLTPAFLRRSYGNMDGCVLGGGELATKITVTPGKVSESEATGFEVDAEGSVYTGEKVTVDLVAGANGWLISDLSVDAPVGP